MTEGVEDVVVYVSSPNIFELHVVNNGVSYLDATEAQSVDLASDLEFYVINFGDGTNPCEGPTSFYSIAAVEDDTVVQIFEPASGGAFVLREEVTINRFEAYTERHTATGSSQPNFSGFKIQATKAVSVYSGNRCAGEDTDQHSTWSSVPAFNQMNNTYLTYAITTAGVSAAGAYGVKIVATQNGTIVFTSILGQSNGLDDGQTVVYFYEYGSGEHIGKVTCSAPCYVMQFVRGESLDTGVSQSVIPPENRFLSFSTRNNFLYSLTSCY